MEEANYWLGFSLLHDIGPKRIQRLVDYFGDLKTAWTTPEKSFQVLGLNQQQQAKLLQQHKQLDLEHEMARIAHVKAFLVTWATPTYPQLLARIDDAPPVLYVRGTLLPGDSRAICIVGTRKATAYGRDTAYQIAYDLATQGITVVSGMAHGVDTAAHEGALDAGGRTLGISGCGISEIYPADNTALAHRIIKQGAVITEFPLGTPPNSKNFPRRNRILSGLALGVLVAEAGERSGALITAGLAAEHGRDVFAVPHNIFSQAGRGTNRLIQDGAKLVMGAQDVLDELNMAHDLAVTQQKAASIAPADETEAKILAALSSDPTHVDDLARQTGLAMTTITSTLTLMELKGLVRNTGQMQYILSR